MLTYDTRKGGSTVDLDRSTLERAPTYASNENPDWGDRTWGEKVHEHYRARPYWE